VGQVVYTPWCDEHGKVIDDGTVSRLEENVYRWTAADPSLRWFTQNSAGLDVSIKDISESVAALALQGPTSGRLLKSIAEADIENLKYFRVTSGSIDGVAVDISRTGYRRFGLRNWSMPTMRWAYGTYWWNEAGPLISSRPECWRSTWRVSKPGCCSSTSISTVARRL
jgi:aminomethyltransferase